MQRDRRGAAGMDHRAGARDDPRRRVEDLGGAVRKDQYPPVVEPQCLVDEPPRRRDRAEPVRRPRQRVVQLAGDRPVATVPTVPDDEHAAVDEWHDLRVRHRARQIGEGDELAAVRARERELRPGRPWAADQHRGPQQGQGEERHQRQDERGSKGGVTDRPARRAIRPVAADAGDEPGPRPSLPRRLEDPRKRFRRRGGRGLRAEPGAERPVQVVLRGHATDSLPKPATRSSASRAARSASCARLRRDL